MKNLLLFTFFLATLTSNAQLSEEEKQELDEICTCAETSLDSASRMLRIIDTAYLNNEETFSLNNLEDYLTLDDLFEIVALQDVFTRRLSASALCLMNQEHIDEAFNAKDIELMNRYSQYLREAGCPNSSTLITMALIDMRTERPQEEEEE